MGLFQKDDNYWCTPVANKQLMLVYYDYYDYAHIYNSRFVNYDCKGFIRLATGSINCNGER